MRPRMRVLLTAIGISLLLAAGAHAGPLFGTSRVVEMHHVGYADGVHLTINFSTGKVVGYRTGPVAGALWGTVGALLDGTYRGGAVTVMNPIGAAGAGYYEVFLDNPYVWIMYTVGGTYLNSGTYAVGPLVEPGAGLSDVPK